MLWVCWPQVDGGSPRWKAIVLRPNPSFGLQFLLPWQMNISKRGYTGVNKCRIWPKGFCPVLVRHMCTRSVCSGIQMSKPLNWVSSLLKMWWVVPHREKNKWGNFSDGDRYWRAERSFTRFRGYQISLLHCLSPVVCIRSSGKAECLASLRISGPWILLPYRFSGLSWWCML